VVAVAFGAAIIPAVGEVDGVPGWVVPLLVVGLATYGVVAVLVAPVLRYRTWRYAVREEEIDVLHGTFVRTRTVIPMARVQHVDTSQGVLGRMLDLATLNVHTAADAHAIPGLPTGVAAALRTEIAQRARVPDAV
jgi:membrane protein YdbS with pleckstrin-like domain